MVLCAINAFGLHCCQSGVSSELSAFCHEEPQWEMCDDSITFEHQVRSIGKVQLSAKNPEFFRNILPLEVSSTRHSTFLRECFLKDLRKKICLERNISYTLNYSIFQVQQISYLWTVWTTSNLMKVWKVVSTFLLPVARETTLWYLCVHSVSTPLQIHWIMKV